MAEIFRQFRNYSLSASPESAILYDRIADNLKIVKEKNYMTCGITDGIKCMKRCNPEIMLLFGSDVSMYMVHANCNNDYRKFSYAGDYNPDLTTL